MNIDKIKEFLLFEAIVGSTAYNLNTPESDVDIKGVYMLPNDYLLTGEYIPQISNETNDITYYELNRFVELLIENNPNILEVLFSDEKDILFCDPKFKILIEHRNLFLTKKLKNTFGGYALSQIKKARGLNKKIVNPIIKEKKTPLDFCHIFDKNDGYMMLATQWLKKNNICQENIGLAQMPNGTELYKLYYSEIGIFKGIIKNNSNSIRHSEIPKGYKLKAFLTYNKNGYIVYCKEYKEYWDWVKKRNPIRYNDNISHNQNYDGKNMLHCNRLLDMAIEIGLGYGVILKRKNRDWLLSIKKGQIPYNDIIKIIDEKKEKLDDVFNNTLLPDDIDPKITKDIILKIRKYE